MRKIPRCMSTQHPDNITVPFFSGDTVMGGEDEIREAYYAFSHLGCDEQMWDCEGKEVDNFVVRKLLANYERYFKENRLGQDLFLTLRIPNPTVERAEAKVLLETLESIPRSFDLAKLFYQEEVVPIFEVILPMTTSHKCMNRIFSYYRDFVAGKQDHRFFEGDITIGEWIGEFKPKRINVIPLIEDMQHMIQADTIVESFIGDKDLQYQRVFLARSDPAENYGAVSAVLINKIALWKLADLERRTGTKIYPILGVGSAPFRGNFRPTNPDNCLRCYPSVQTFTVQSAFKYDYPVKTAIDAIRKVMETPRKAPVMVDERRCMEIIEKVSLAYRDQISILAPLIQQIALHIPPRRKRKLHIGLFGYCREINGISLPRAITFCASLYSLGLPPETLGLHVLDGEDIRYLKSIYFNFEDDLRDAFRYINPDVLRLLPRELGREILKGTELVDYEEDAHHKEATSQVIKCFKEKSFDVVQEHILRAAHSRKFLG